jgi:hypothetical protein
MQQIQVKVKQAELETRTVFQVSLNELGRHDDGTE